MARRNSSGVDVANRGEDGRHRVVHPDVERAEAILDPRRRVVERVSVRDIERKDERFAAELLDLPCGGLQPLLATSDEPDAGSIPRETTSCRAANPCGRARNRDHLHRTPMYPSSRGKNARTYSRAVCIGSTSVH